MQTILYYFFINKKLSNLKNHVLFLIIVFGLNLNIFSGPNDSELYTFPPTLTVVLRGCVRIGPTKEKTTAVTVLYFIAI